MLGHTPDVARLLPDLATFQPTFLLAVPRVFEKVYNGAEQQASEQPGQGPIFHAAARTAIAWSRAFGTSDADARRAAPGSPLRLRHALFDRLVYAQAAGRGRRPGPLRGVRRRRRSGNGSAISSAARGSPSSRATG